MGGDSVASCAGGHAPYWEPAAPEWPFGPEPDFQRLVVLVEGNARAVRCYEKAGFRIVGVLHKAVRHHLSGEWEDEYLMELVL